MNERGIHGMAAAVGGPDTAQPVASRTAGGGSGWSAGADHDAPAGRRPVAHQNDPFRRRLHAAETPRWWGIND